MFTSQIMAPSVIVVDDDNFTKTLYVDFLKENGIEVKGIGHSGKTAVELYEKFRPDVVLLDVMMPEYDGFYGLANIKKINPNATVVMVTADLTADTEKKLHDLGATEIMYKPYEIDDLVSLINKVAKENVPVKNA